MVLRRRETLATLHAVRIRPSGPLPSGMTHGREDTSLGHEGASDPQSHPHTNHPRPGEDACCSGSHPCGGHHHGQSGGCCSGHGDCEPHDEVLVFSRQKIRDLDRLAVERYGIPSILLMENAARGVSGVVLEGISRLPEPCALIFCGPGNNGGDGFAIARLLHNRGVRVAVLLGADRARIAGDARTNLTIIERMQLPIFDASVATTDAVHAAFDAVGEPDVVIDALLGTGADRPASGAIADLIGHIHALRKGGSTVVAVDLPSGLDADTGEPCAGGACVEADLTVALAGLKKGFLTLGAQKYVGELVVVDIGAPAALLAELGEPMHHHAPGE